MMKFYLRWAITTFFGILYLRNFCGEWDLELNSLIDLYGKKAILRDFSIKLGKTEIWIGHEFYAYGFRIDSKFSRGNQFRPYLKTMRRLDSLVGSIRIKNEHGLQ